MLSSRRVFDVNQLLSSSFFEFLHAFVSADYWSADLSLGVTEENLIGHSVKTCATVAFF